jgi:thiosulfate/3-mercaptopyruvate sulfurtransferase
MNCSPILFATLAWLLAAGCPAGLARVGFAQPGAAPGYARPELLVETDWVADHARDPKVRIVDVRSAAAYSAGHLPGAVRLEEGPLRNPEDRLTYLPKPETLVGLLRQAGITNETRVVVYDDQGGRMAARLWYVLNAFGHERVSLVNGGWNKWLAEQRPVTREAVAPPPGDFTPKASPALSCPSDELLRRRPGVMVLDARSPQEYRGEQTSPGATRAGRIPGAVNVEWKENVTGPHLTFKPAAELKALYEQRGITPEKEIVTHCASGGRAAHTLFTLKLLGYPKVRIYYGSFSDYTTRPDAPVEK